MGVLRVTIHHRLPAIGCGIIQVFRPLDGHGRVRPGKPRDSFVVGYGNFYSVADMKSGKTQLNKDHLQTTTHYNDRGYMRLLLK